MANASNQLDGKTALVTGATSGIGLETAVALAKQGARVVITGPTAAETEAAASEVKARSGSQLVEHLVADFSSQAQVRKLADDYRARQDRLDILVNNVGASYPRREVTEDGVEKTFAVNHLGGFLLTQLLLDLLQQSAPARVVNVASSAHNAGRLDFENLQYERGGYGLFPAYARSKMAIVLATRELAHRLQGRGVTVNCLHPGTVATKIWGERSPLPGPIFALVKRFFMLTPEEGARTMVYLASSPEVEGVTGKYFEKCKERRPHKLALDDALAKRLWAESEKLVGLA